MRPARVVLVLAAAVAATAACRKLETRELNAVQALRARARPRFQPPADGLLTGAQIDMFLKVRQAAGRQPPSEVAGSLGVDPAELAWVRARIAEALLASDAKQVGDSASETYGAALGRLRETRRSTRDPKAAARLDAEIGTLERERATLRRNDSASAASRNAVLVAGRRAELERVGP